MGGASVGGEEFGHLVTLWAATISTFPLLSGRWVISRSLVTSSSLIGGSGHDQLGSRDCKKKLVRRTRRAPASFPKWLGADGVLGGGHTDCDLRVLELGVA